MESPSMRALLELYLATSGPGARAERARLRSREAERAAAHASWSGRLAVGRAKRAELLALLGAPDRERVDAIGYELSGWPGYAYELRFAASGVLLGSGFERVGARPELPAVRDRREWPGVLARAGATRAEVHALLGEPAADVGWWPIESLDYGEGVVIELRHGIVEADAAGGPTP